MMKSVNTNHPDLPEFLEIVRALEKKGHMAWLAGGAVRDFIMGRVPRDLDLVTDAEVSEIESLIELSGFKTKPIGKQFGVILVINRGKAFEVASFRKDIGIKDGRHPEKIEKATPIEDAQRRDFTVNGLFYDFKTAQIIDYVEGQKDISHRILRSIGEPRLRFAEDHLRILRAYRFASQLGFQLDPILNSELGPSSPLLKSVSAERLQAELDKLFSGEHRANILPRMIQNQVFSEVAAPLNWDFKKWKALPLSPNSAWMEWMLWGLNCDSTDIWLKAMVQRRLATSRIHKDFIDQVSMIIKWNKNLLHKPRLGALVDSLWLTERVELINSILQAGEFLTEDAKEHLNTALNLRLKWIDKPEPHVRASDLPDLKGVQLGNYLKEAWYLQLEQK